MPVNSFRPLIIGGGIAGPILALFLKEAGIQARIFEASAGPSEAGGALGLAPNGMRVLAAAGLDEQVHDAGVIGYEWAFENATGQLLACSRVRGDRRYGQSTVMVARAELHRVLVEHVRTKGIDVNYNKRLVRIDDKPDQQIAAHFEDGTTAVGDFIVGADGIRSQVRACTMPGAVGPAYTGLRAPGGFSPCLAHDVKPRSNQRVHFIFGQHAFFGYFHTITAAGPKTVWWSTATAPLETREQMARTPRSDLQHYLMKLHGDWAHPVPDLIQSCEQILDIAVYDVPSLPRWRAGRTILIGDAAHAVAPHSGQGASMALEDAMVLAKLIRESNGATLDSVFESFENARRPRTDKVIAMGRRLGQRKKGMSRFEYWMEQLMIRLFVPVAQMKNRDWLYSYRIGAAKF